MAPLEEVQETQRPFQPGTTGWTASDLDDPAIERQWLRGSYEIVEGVLAIKPAAYFRGGTALSNLLYRLHVYLDEIKSQGKLSIEVDLVLSATRVVKADAVFLTPEDEKLQAAAAAHQGRTDP